MSCIDTHSHIYGEEFDADREEVIARAKAAGVSHIFLPNINEGSVRPMLNLCERHPDFCYPMIGLHPEDVTEKWPSVLAAMEQRLQKTGHPFIGIGEVGLDFYCRFFKFTTEFKMSFGLINLLVKEDNIYATSVQSLRSKMMQVSFIFE